MFTGIVETQASVLSSKKTRGGQCLTLRVPAAWSRLPLGTSVCVDGACLTVSARAKGRLSFDLLRETLRRTHFYDLRPGQRMNLERAMKQGKRFEGHFVQGHVDGTGVVRRVDSAKREKSVEVSIPRPLKPLLIPKGSVALNGVSLTLGRITRGRFRVHLVPHTLRKTNLGLLKTGQRVNLEADALLKFFHRLTRSGGHYKLINSRTVSGILNEKS